MLHHRPLIS
jgi:hypothetical protein